MVKYDSVKNFLDELEFQVGLMGSDRAQELWYKCEDLEESLGCSLDEDTLSVLNRIQQETYLHAIDTIVDALRFTLLEAGKEIRKEESQEE